MTTDLILVSIACGTDAEAQALARGLVEQRLAACCQTHPIQSTYRWQGAIEAAPEVMLTAKTVAAKFQVLEAYVRQHHSYDVPEIVATPVTCVSDAYAAWLRAVLDG